MRSGDRVTRVGFTPVRPEHYLWVLPVKRLFALILLAGLSTSFWVYFAFFHWTVIGVSPTKPTSARHSDLLEYGRRFRTSFALGTKAMANENERLLGFAHRGQAIPADDLDRLLRASRESCEQFDSQVIPTSMQSVHKKASQAHRLWYESALFLRESVDSEGHERIRLLREAVKKAKEAKRLGDDGVKEFYRVWKNTPKTHDQPSSG